MRSRFFLIALAFYCASLLALPVQERNLDVKKVEELCTALGMEGKDLVKETQNSWLRKAGKERWEMEELPSYQRAAVIEWAINQKIYDSWCPALESYHSALILGATVERMENRLKYLAELWQQGIRFREIIWLTGQRPLDPKIEHCPSCRTETSAAMYIWEKEQLPDEMRGIPVTWISVPMKTEGDKRVRPNTQDTIVAWFSLCSPKPGHCCLILSDQPFCGYQYAVVDHLFPKEIQFDVVGRGVDPYSHGEAAAITLDAVARWLYQQTRPAQCHKNGVDHEQ